MDGTSVGLNYIAVIEILKINNEYSRKMFDRMLYCYGEEQEVKAEMKAKANLLTITKKKATT